VERNSEERTAGTTFVEAVLVTPFRDAVTSTGVGASTDAAATENIAIVWPAGMNTVGGTVIAGLVVDSATLTPPAGAGDASVTRFQIGVVPDEIAELANVTEESNADLTAGTTLTVADREPDPLAAVTCTAAVSATLAAAKEN
jgi:hypothetical protein